MTDYKDLIEILRSYSTEVISYKIDGAFAYGVTAAADAIEQLVKERDTAVADLKELAVCDYCKWLIGGDCTDLEHEECHGEHWEWRGVQEASE